MMMFPVTFKVTNFLFVYNSVFFVHPLHVTAAARKQTWMGKLK